MANQVLQVKWADKVLAVCQVNEVFQVFQAKMANKGQKVNKVQLVDQVCKAHQVKPVKKAHQANEDSQVHEVHPSPDMDLFMLDTLKKPMFQNARLVIKRCGTVIPCSTLKVTKKLTLKILVTLALVSEPSPPCHSCSATSTNNATLLLEMITLTGCQPANQCQ